MLRCARRAFLALPALLVTLTIACTAGGSSGTSTPAATTSTEPSRTSSAATPAIEVPTTTTAATTASPTATATAVTPTPKATSAPTPQPTPPLIPQPGQASIRASRLAIPALGIDAVVQASQVVLDTSPTTPGCPPTPPGQETFTVPEQGIATPVAAIEGLENKAWIFGHSRWLGAPGVFYRLQDINVGDEVFIDGVDRTTGERLAGRRFVVDGLYLADIESGGRLVTAGSAAETPAKPVVILQTSVREDGAGKQWILDRQTVIAKSRNLVEGDLNDPCKYLLLFVFAKAS